MNITWRDAEYDFQPLFLQGGKDKVSAFSNITCPIFGADTESVQLPGRYEPQCFTISDPQAGERLVYLPEDDFSLYYYLEDFIYETVENYLAQDIKQCFHYFHNLEYDWLQLIKKDPKLLEMAKVGVGLSTDYELFKIKNYSIVLAKHALFTGSAPHFTIQIRASKKEKLAIHFRDTFSFFPGSLAKLAKDLKLEVGKMERQEDLGQIDYRGMPDEEEEKEYFETYAKLDARITRLAAEQIRDLHLHAAMTKIRVSAPSYAIHRLYALMPEEAQIRSGVDDPKTMQLIFDTYRGGRTGGIYHGKIEDVTVADFHSSYPASMCCLPSFSPRMEYVSLEGDDLSVENVMAVCAETGNGFFRVSGIEHDAEYPGLITTINGKLTPIYGEFQNMATTGVELYTAWKSGTLDITQVHEGVVLLDMEEEPFLPFRTFAETAYTRKAASEKGSVLYTSAKLELNASYGKLIESRSQTMIGASDNRHELPYLESMEKEFAQYWYNKYLDVIEAGEQIEDHYDAWMDEILENFDDDAREKMKEKPLGEFNISGRIYGRHVVPAAASLITATSRARLLAAMKVLDGLYWDTDSIFFRDLADDEIARRLAKGSEWLPANVLPLTVGEELGALDIEIRRATGYLAGTKRYYLMEGDHYKSATHGIPALPKDQTEAIIQSLSLGKNYAYESKVRPLKAKEAKTIADIGSFRSKTYESLFHLDDRLTWTKTDDGWVGQVKRVIEQGSGPDLTDEAYATYCEKLYQDVDPIKELIHRLGKIRIPKKEDYFYSVYQSFSRSAKAKYFRKVGKSIDEWADEAGLDTRTLLDQLGGMA
jgi:hypothetical protein